MSARAEKTTEQVLSLSVDEQTELAETLALCLDQSDAAKSPALDIVNNGLNLAQQLSLFFILF